MVKPICPRCEDRKGVFLHGNAWECANCGLIGGREGFDPPPVRVLKYENIAEIGDVIFAYDFQPVRLPDGSKSPDYPDHWVIGVVAYKGTMAGGARGYGITVTDSSHNQYLCGTGVFVPFQVSMLEYDNRVKRVMTDAERREQLRDHAEDLSIG